MNSCLKNKLYAIFKTQCLLCLQSCNADEIICKNCLKDLPENITCCPECAIPSETNTRCPACCRSANSFDKIFAPLRYEYPLRELMHQFKYHQSPGIASVLSEYILDKVSFQKNDYDLILAVPLHPLRLKQRGFNQSILIASYIAKKMKFPFKRNLVKKTRNTQPQSTISNLKDRKNNLRNAFEVSNHLHEKSVLLIDDVVTTGSTVNTICALLKQKGAKHVDVIACCRAGKK